MTKKRRLKHRNSIKRHTREYRWTIKAKLGKRNMEKQKKEKIQAWKKGPTGSFLNSGSCHHIAPLVKKW